MINCLECNKPLPPRIEGKRERKFCDNKGACKQRYWAKQNAKAPDIIKVPIEQHQNMVIFVEDESGEWVVGDRKGRFKWADAENKTEIKFIKPTAASFDGERINHVKDESCQWEEPKDNSDLIKKYETELSGLQEGKFAAARKKWLINKIKELRQ